MSHVRSIEVHIEEFLWGIQITAKLQGELEVFAKTVNSFTAWKVSKYVVLSGPYFPAFGLNTGRYDIQFECGEIRTRKNSVIGQFSKKSLLGSSKCASKYDFLQMATIEVWERKNEENVYGKHSFWVSLSSWLVNFPLVLIAARNSSSWQVLITCHLERARLRY